jgi:Outer membrane protein beta-barrel domain
MKLTKIIAATLVIGAGFMSAPAMAAGPFYAGLGVGQATCSGCDSQTGFPISGGYQMNPGVAAEVSYMDFGSSNGVRTSAFGVYGVGSLPMGNNISLIGKLGGTRASASGGGESVSSTGLGFGLGAAYALSSTTEARLTWDRVSFDGGDVNFISLNGIFRF